MGTLTINSEALVDPPFAFGIREGSCRDTDGSSSTPVFIKRGGVALTSATEPIVGDRLYEDIALTIPFTNLNSRVQFRIGVGPLLYNSIYDVDSNGEIIFSSPCSP